MSNITRNQRRNPFTLGEIAQSVGDYFIRIKRYDEAKEEYKEAIMAYNLVLQSSSHFAFAQKHKRIIQKILDELSIKNVYVFPPPALVNDLSQWLQNNFTKAIEMNWQTLEEIFGTKQLAFRTAASKAQSIKRAKHITFNVEQTIVLAVELTPLENQEISILIHVSVIEPQTELPENLTLILLSETGESLTEIQASSHNNYFKQPLKAKSGEQFSVKLVLEECSFMEKFII